jgi:AhpD family alkylhydroperoxidase
VMPKDPRRADGGIKVIQTTLKNIFGQPGGQPLLVSPPTPNPSTAMSTHASAPAPKAGLELPSCCDGGASHAVHDRASSTPPRSPTAATDQSPATAADQFAGFLRQANQAALIDARSKKLMVIALSVAQRCEPCLKTHMKGALEMGLSKAEIEEAAWLGIAFGGSPAMMLYRETCAKLGC